MSSHTKSMMIFRQTASTLLLADCQKWNIFWIFDKLNATHSNQFLLLRSALSYMRECKWCPPARVGGGRGPPSSRLKNCLSRAGKKKEQFSFSLSLSLSLSISLSFLARLKKIFTWEEKEEEEEERGRRKKEGVVERGAINRRRHFSPLPCLQDLQGEISPFLLLLKYTFPISSLATEVAQVFILPDPISHLR